MMKHDNSRVLILLEEVIYLKEEGFGSFGWSVHLDEMAAIILCKQSGWPLDQGLEQWVDS